MYEIVDSEFPGYVYLVSSYLLTECIYDYDGKYKAVQCQREYLTYQAFDNSHGPAVVKLIPPTGSLLERITGSDFSVDRVFCVRCLLWPLQAAEWPKRHRSYGWPDSATIDSVVSTGCDVVQVAHRRCRQNEWRRQRQHRLSFSRAEIVLLNSWMPAQQIAYHMLRVFIKTERLTDSSGAGTVSKVRGHYLSGAKRRKNFFKVPPHF